MHFPSLYTMAKGCSSTTCTLTSQFPEYKIHTANHETLRSVPRVHNRKQTTTNLKVLNFSHTMSNHWINQLWCSRETTWKPETELNNLKGKKKLFSLSLPNYDRSWACSDLIKICFEFLNCWQRDLPNWPYKPNLFLPAQDARQFWCFQFLPL